MSPDSPPTIASDESLIRRYRTGEQEAASALYLRYARRLRGLVAKRCKPDLAGRFDADDVTQSAFRAFFTGVRREAYDAPPGGEIWGLLVTIAVNKVRNQIDRHTAARRDYRVTAADAGHDPGEVAGRDEAAAAFLRLVVDEQVAALPEGSREIVRLRVEGYEVADIADRTGRSRRTVERVLQRFRDSLAGP